MSVDQNRLADPGCHPMNGNRSIPCDLDVLAEAAYYAEMRKRDAIPPIESVLPWDELAPDARNCYRAMAKAVARMTIIMDSSRFALVEELSVAQGGQRWNCEIDERLKVYGNLQVPRPTENTDANSGDGRESP